MVSKDLLLSSRARIRVIFSFFESHYAEDQLSSQNHQNQIERVQWYFDIEKPIFCRPSFCWQTPELIAQASNSGALGVLSAGLMTPEELAENVGRIRELTDKPFAVEIFPEQKTAFDAKKFELLNKALRPVREDLGLDDPEVPKGIDFEAQFKKILDLDVKILGVCLGGLREPYMEALEEKDVRIYGVSSNLKDSKVLVASGVKTILAQGWGAPGLRSFCESSVTASAIDSLTYFSELNRALKIPFVADASLLSEDAVKAALQLGASGIVISDGLINTSESTFPQTWRLPLSYFSDGASEVNSFAMGRPSRSLYTGILEAIQENELPVLDFPYQWFALKDIFKKAEEFGSMDLAYIEFGQSAYQVKTGSVKEVVDYVHGWIKNE